MERNSNLECPVTLEMFEEQGDAQPRVLPDCGHSVSKSAIDGLRKAV